MSYEHVWNLVLKFSDNQQTVFKSGENIFYEILLKRFQKFSENLRCFRELIFWSLLSTQEIYIYQFCTQSWSSMTFLFALFRREKMAKWMVIAVSVGYCFAAFALGKLLFVFVGML